MANLPISIALVAEPTNPAAQTGAGFVYSKVLSGTVHLFYLDSDGISYQLTPTYVAPITPGVRVFGVSLIGAINGVNTVYVTPVMITPTVPSVYVNGLRMAPGASRDYVLSEGGGFGTGYDTITFAYAPRTGDVLQIDYEPA